MSNWFALIETDSRLLRNAHAMHQALWDLFPSHEQTDRPRLLYRVLDWDRQGRDARDPVRVLALCTKEPSTSETPAVRVLNERTYNPAPEAESILAFALLAVPTRTELAERTSAGNETPGMRGRGRRRPVASEDERRRWLARKLDPAAQLIEARVVKERMIRFDKPAPDGKKHIAGYYVACYFEGLLAVRDPEKLIALTLEGIGTGKGYGCGLLTLARPDNWMS